MSLKRSIGYSVGFWICIALIATLYLWGTKKFGSANDIAQSFLEYQQASLDDESLRLAALTSPRAFEEFAELRQQILYANRAQVENLKFEKRFAVLAARSLLHRKQLSIDELVDGSDQQAYLALRQFFPPDKNSLRNMRILEVAQLSPTSGRIYVIGDDMQRFFPTDLALSLYRGMWIEATKTNDVWQVNFEPLVKNYFALAESSAKRLEPSGNRYIIKILLNARDQQEIDKLWRPIIETKENQG